MGVEAPPPSGTAVFLYRLRCGLAEWFISWALKISPPRYGLSIIELLAEKEREIERLNTELEWFRSKIKGAW